MVTRHDGDVRKCRSELVATIPISWKVLEKCINAPQWAGILGRDQDSSYPIY